MAYLLHVAHRRSTASHELVCVNSVSSEKPRLPNTHGQYAAKYLCILQCRQRLSGAVRGPFYRAVIIGRGSGAMRHTAAQGLSCDAVLSGPGRNRGQKKARAMRAGSDAGALPANG